MAKKKSKPAKASRRGKSASKAKSKPAASKPAKRAAKPVSKRPEPAPSRTVRSRSAKPQKKAPSATKQVAPTKRRTPSPIQVINNLVDQRKILANKQRSLERKLQREDRRTYQDKIRRELKSVGKSLDSVRSKIPVERKRAKEQVQLRKEKGAIYSKRYRLNLKMKSLYEKGGQAKQAKEFEKLSNQYNYLGGKLRDINRQLGYEVAKPKTGTGAFAEEPSEGGGGAGMAAPSGAPESVGGFFREPNPLASWQVQSHLKDTLASGNWTAITVNGTKYGKSEEIELRMAVAAFARDAYKEGSDVQVEVSFNPDSGEFIYDIAR